MQHKVKLEVVKAKQRVYDDLHARLDSKEGDTNTKEGCAAGWLEMEMY